MKDIHEVAFDPSWDESTIEAAFEESVRSVAFYPEWADGIDRKTITIFTLATAIAAAAPGLLSLGGELGHWTVAFTILAAVAWLGAADGCYRSYKPCDIRVDPNPRRLLDQLWLGRSPTSYRFYRIRDMGKTFDYNRDQVNRKALWLSRATGATIIEVVFLTAAFVSQATGF